MTAIFDCVVNFDCFVNELLRAPSRVVWWHTGRVWDHASRGTTSILQEPPFGRGSRPMGGRSFLNLQKTPVVFVPLYCFDIDESKIEPIRQLTEFGHHVAVLGHEETRVIRIGP
jgi:hypothetical protein